MACFEDPSFGVGVMLPVRITLPLSGAWLTSRHGPTSGQTRSVVVDSAESFLAASLSGP
jgi:hypothetical protein